MKTVARLALIISLLTGLVLVALSAEYVSTARAQGEGEGEADPQGEEAQAPRPPGQPLAPSTSRPPPEKTGFLAPYIGLGYGMLFADNESASAWALDALLPWHKPGASRDLGWMLRFGVNFNKIAESGSTQLFGALLGDLSFHAGDAKGRRRYFRVAAGPVAEWSDARGVAFGGMPDVAFGVRNFIELYVSAPVVVDEVGLLWSVFGGARASFGAWGEIARSGPNVTKKTNAAGASAQCQAYFESFQRARECDNDENCNEGQTCSSTDYGYRCTDCIPTGCPVIPYANPYQCCSQALDDDQICR